MTTRKLLVATSNPGKLHEVRTAIEHLPLRVTALTEHPPWSAPTEDANTFEENAKSKALYYAGLSGLWTLADDSGLEVDALGLAPGVRSARYAGPMRDDAANNAKLVSALAGVPPARRTARFRCVLALASPQTILVTTEGSLEGTIVDQPCGEHGFGYDPHFFVPDRRRTTAQMSTEEKNRISHRGRALRAMIEALKHLLAEF